MIAAEPSLSLPMLLGCGRILTVLGNRAQRSGKEKDWSFDKTPISFAELARHTICHSDLLYLLSLDYPTLLQALETAALSIPNESTRARDVFLAMNQRARSSSTLSLKDEHCKQMHDWLHKSKDNDFAISIGKISTIKYHLCSALAMLDFLLYPGHRSYQVALNHLAWFHAYQLFNLHMRSVALHDSSLRNLCEEEGAILNHRHAIAHSMVFVPYAVASLREDYPEFIKNLTTLHQKLSTLLTDIDGAPLQEFFFYRDVGVFNSPTLSITQTADPLIKAKEKEQPGKTLRPPVLLPKQATASEHKPKPKSQKKNKTDELNDLQAFIDQLDSLPLQSPGKKIDGAPVQSMHAQSMEAIFEQMKEIVTKPASKNRDKMIRACLETLDHYPNLEETAQAIDTDSGILKSFSAALSLESKKIPLALQAYVFFHSEDLWLTVWEKILSRGFLLDPSYRPEHSEPTLGVTSFNFLCSFLLGLQCQRFNSIFKLQTPALELGYDAYEKKFCHISKFYSRIIQQRVLPLLQSYHYPMAFQKENEVELRTLLISIMAWPDVTQTMIKNHPDIKFPENLWLAYQLEKMGTNFRESLERYCQETEILPPVRKSAQILLDHLNQQTRKNEVSEVHDLPPVAFPSSAESCDPLESVAPYSSDDQFLSADEGIQIDDSRPATKITHAVHEKTTRHLGGGRS